MAGAADARPGPGRRAALTAVGSSDVRRRQRGHHGALGQRLDGVRARSKAATRRRAAAPRRAARRSRRHGRPRRREQAADDAHSTKVTLLISRKCGSPQQHLLDRRVAQEPHPLLARRLLDLRGRPPVEDQVADVIGQIEQLADRRPALVAGAAALDAPGAFVETRRGGQRRVHPRLVQHLGGHRRRPLAVRADQPHQPLRQHAVERRDELIRLDAHVQEPAQHVDDVVGVHGREHQVPGERRLDRDLRGLRVADLADHDLVRIVAEDRAQARARRSAPSSR